MHIFFHLIKYIIDILSKTLYFTGIPCQLLYVYFMWHLERYLYVESYITIYLILYYYKNFQFWFSKNVYQNNYIYVIDFSIYEFQNTRIYKTLQCSITYKIMHSWKTCLDSSKRQIIYAFVCLKKKNY